MAARNCGCDRGFTLIELMVAITILAMVAVLSWRGLDGIVRARIALNEELAQTRSMQISFAQLQSDCAQLATPALTGNRVPIDISPDRLLLIRTVSADQQPGRLHVVSYRLLNGVLTRQESAGTRDLDELATLWQAALDDSMPAPALPLQSGVANMQLRLWDTLTGWNDLEAVAGNSKKNYNGLEVNLIPPGKTHAIVKVLLLGAAG
jgi:general secretion pathway protein J